MQKTNILTKTLYCLLVAITAFATMFIFTACDSNDNIIPNDQTDDTDDSGDDGKQTDDKGSDDSSTKDDEKTTYTISVASNLSEANAVFSGAGTYLEGTSVTITLTNNSEGYYLDHWDDNSRKDSVVVTADSDKTIMAYFEKGQSVVVSSYKVAMKNGTVDKKDGQLVLTATDQQACSYIVNNG